STDSFFSIMPPHALILPLFPYTTLFRSADLGRGDTNVGDIDVEQFRAIGADRELTLAAGPDLNLPVGGGRNDAGMRFDIGLMHRDRKSTRLNSSHVAISYAVFCLKKKKN